MAKHILWAAISTAATKLFEREALLPETHDVNLTISGMIDGEKIREKVSGSFIVNPGGTRVRSIPPKTIDLLAAVFYQLSPRKRREVLDGIKPSKLTSDEASMEAASELLSAAKVDKTENVRGALAFESA